MRTITVLNQKGGCGKTTTAVNLAASLGVAGARVLLVDLDPQSHCAAALGIPEQRVSLDTTDFILSAGGKPPDLSRLLWRGARGVDVIASRVRLAGVESPGGGLADRPARERSLASALERLGDRFDACVLDCPPAIGLLTFNAIVAATVVLIPVETSFFSVQGAARQIATIRALARRLNVRPACLILPTMHDPESPVARDLLEEVKRRFAKSVLRVVIRRDAALQAAASFGQPITEHAPESGAARDYAALAATLAELGVLGGATVDQLHHELTDDLGDDAPESPHAEENAGEDDELADPSDQPTHERLPPEHGDAPSVVTRPGPDVYAALGGRLDAIARACKLHATAQRGAPLRLVVSDHPEPTPSVRRLFGARATARGVLFVQPLTLGARVCIAGDFNAWTPDACPMQRNEQLSVFERCVPMAPGLHRYRLVIDGQWMIDPYNREWALNEQGEPDSVIEATPNFSGQAAG